MKRATATQSGTRRLIEQGIPHALRASREVSRFRAAPAGPTKMSTRYSCSGDVSPSVRTQSTAYRISSAAFFRSSLRLMLAR
jgi:hypothetical protein